VRTPSRRLLVLLCAAVIGVLVVLGLVVTAVLGAVGLVVFALLAALLVAAGIVRGRALLAPPPLPPGRTCTCCTTTHFDPVKVV
jgi:hypothetical protein